MPVLKNARHELFCQAVAKGSTVTDAHEQAGFARNDGNASAMARRPEVKARITEINGRVAEKVENKLAIDKAWIMGRLIENLDRALQAKAVETKDGSTGEYKYDGGVANRALELLGKELGMFIERKEVGTPGEFAEMGDDDLLKSIREKAKTLGVGVPKHLDS